MVDRDHSPMHAIAAKGCFWECPLTAAVTGLKQPPKG
jgi:hypothetical protein